MPISSLAASGSAEEKELLKVATSDQTVSLADLDAYIRTGIPFAQSKLARALRPRVKEMAEQAEPPVKRQSLVDVRCASASIERPKTTNQTTDSGQISAPKPRADEDATSQHAHIQHATVKQVASKQVASKEVASKEVATQDAPSNAAAKKPVPLVAAAPEAPVHAAASSSAPPSPLTQFLLAPAYGAEAMMQGPIAFAKAAPEIGKHIASGVVDMAQGPIAAIETIPVVASHAVQGVAELYGTAATGFVGDMLKGFGGYLELLQRPTVAKAAVTAAAASSSYALVTTFHGVPDVGPLMYMVSAVVLAIGGAYTRRLGQKT